MNSVENIEKLLKEKENPNLIKTFLDLDPEKAIKEYQYWYNLSLQYFYLTQYSRINEFISYYGQINFDKKIPTTWDCTITDYFLDRINDDKSSITQAVKRLLITQYEMVYSYLYFPKKEVLDENPKHKNKTKIINPGNNIY